MTVSDRPCVARDLKTGKPHISTNIRRAFRDATHHRTAGDPVALAR